MKALALDISSHCGYSLLEKTDQPLPNLLAYGTVHLGQTVFEISQHYPSNYYLAATIMAQKILDLVTMYKPDVIVVEQTVKGRARYTQKSLEWLHFAFLDLLSKQYPEYISNRLFYIDPSQWRKVLGVVLTKEEKKNNAKLSKAKSVAAKTGLKLDKKLLGIAGKFTKKHAAVKYVNALYGLNMKIKDNDTCDAVCVGLGYLNGGKTCDGR